MLSARIEVHRPHVGFLALKRMKIGILFALAECSWLARLLDIVGSVGSGSTNLSTTSPDAVNASK